MRSFVLEALREKPELDEGARPDHPQPLDADEWGAELTAWAAGHPHLGYLADDHRDSIYAGRGV